MNSLERLIQYFSRLPGIGKKSATRIVYYLLKQNSGFLQTFGSSLSTMKESIFPCSVCGSFTESDPCPICTDPQRDLSMICVVEQSQDIGVIESTREYNGRYHVLGGVISPMDGIGPKELALDKLISRVKDKEVKEVILALNPTVEGDTTALYLLRAFQGIDVRTTKLASGLPVGGDLEYAGALTLSRSIQGRSEVHYE